MRYPSDCSSSVIAYRAAAAFYQVVHQRNVGTEGLSYLRHLRAGYRRLDKQRVRTGFAVALGPFHGILKAVHSQGVGASDDRGVIMFPAYPQRL